jgi:hypothetical protein
MNLIYFYLQLIVFSFVTLAQELPTIYLDPSSGNYIITYIGGEGDTLQTFFEPSTKINAKVECTVSLDSIQYSYNYIIYNGNTSQQRLLALSVEYFSDLILVNRPDSNWYSAKFKYFDIRNWANITSSNGVKSQFDGIAPDSSQDGFSIVSLGLPTIINCYLRGLSSTVFFPEEPSKDVMELLNPLRKFPNNSIIKKTIGPKDPPYPLIISSFLDTLLNYVSQSFALDWIIDETTANKYTNLFTTAKDQIIQGDSSASRSTLKNVLQEVDKDSTNNLTSEAYALLRYNTEYLIEQLPQSSPNLTVNLTNSQGALLTTGSLKYYDAGWKDAIDNGDGTFTVITVKQTVSLKMTYEYASQTVSNVQAQNNTYTFQTVNTAVQLQNSQGSLIDEGTVKYYSGGWREFGTTLNGIANKELLPKNYSFRMTYAFARNDKQQDIGVDSTVVFQTVNASVQLKEIGRAHF